MDRLPKNGMLCYIFLVCIKYQQYLDEIKSDDNFPGRKSSIN